jgi:hypothetical protein
MSITRAQQAKQMLQNGGRIGLRFGNRGPGEASRGPQGPAGGASAGGNYGGNRNPSQDYGGRDTSDDFGQFERRQRQNQELQGAGFLGKDLGMNIGEQDRLAKFGDFIKGGGIIGNVLSGIFSGGTGKVKPPLFQGGGGGSQAMATIPMWMQLGFNSEAEYLASLEQDEDKDKETEAEEGLRLAFKADGGRIGAQEGGIMPRLNQLGSGVSSAEQMLQGINQRLESAESSLGGGGVGQDVTGNNPMEIPVPFMGRPVLTEMPGYKGPRPQQKPLQQLQQADPNSSLLGVFQSRPENTTGSIAQIPASGGVNFEDLYPNAGQKQISNFRPMRGGAEMFEAAGIPAAGYADGGNVVGGEFDFESARQMYGLGKLVKKVTKTVKKIAKSPIGKAALLYAGGAGLGSFGRTGKIFSPGMFKPANIMSGLFGLPGGSKLVDPTPGIFGKLGLTKGGGSLVPTGLGFTAVASLLGGLTAEEEQQAKELADSSTDFDLEKARNSILAAKREQYMMDVRARGFKADGGRIEYQEGSKEPVAKKTMPLLDMGGKEMDLRAEGGFVPIGRMEKADDVPARLSKNEFVFTADAVRNAGDGDVDKGAEVMYNMMKNLEAGGEVSEESQGLEGARKMFQTSQRLEEVL